VQPLLFRSVERTSVRSWLRKDLRIGGVFCSLILYIWRYEANSYVTTQARQECLLILVVYITALCSSLNTSTFSLLHVCPVLLHPTCLILQFRAIAVALRLTQSMQRPSLAFVESIARLRIALYAGCECHRYPHG
jgi:hypothetical protein